MSSALALTSGNHKSLALALNMKLMSLALALIMNAKSLALALDSETSWRGAGGSPVTLTDCHPYNRSAVSVIEIANLRIERLVLRKCIL